MTDATLEDTLPRPRRAQSGSKIAAAVAARSLANRNDDSGESHMGNFTIQRHDQVENTNVVLPLEMTVTQARDFLNAQVQDLDQIIHFNRRFNFRPDDGANAAANVVARMYGISVGVTIETPFGPIHPEARSINVGYGQSRIVPWGKMAIAALENTYMSFRVGYNDQSQACFQIDVEAPNKWKGQLDEMFNEIQRELETNSIYKGKALCGANVPEFLDLSGFDASAIQFSNDVQETLEIALFGAIKHADLMRAHKVPLKRTFLLTGPYGTGKSSVGMMAAQTAEGNGWTFITARTGLDSVHDVIATARMYQPAVVLIEDIDGPASTADPSEVAEMLETFDGVTAKDSEIIVILTANHPERIHAGMLRPGRVDYVLRIGELDRDGTERLLRAVIDPKMLADDIDFDAVHSAMVAYDRVGNTQAIAHAFEPAFVRETAARALTWGLMAANGEAFQLTTQDLVRAAVSLHDQQLMLKGAGEGTARPTFEQMLERTVRSVLDASIITDRDHDDRPPFLIKERDDNDD
jgi:transitional endoplasmic reticulum ATPase